MLIGILPLSISMILSMISIGYILLNRKKLYTSLNFILFSFTYLFYGIIFFLSFYLSTEILVNMDVSPVFWNISIIMRIITLSMNFTIYSLTLVSNKIQKIPTFTIFFYVGIIICLMSSQAPVEIIKTSTFYMYRFNNPLLLIFLVIFDILIITFVIYVHIKNRSKITDPNSEKYLIFSIFLLTSIIFLYTIYSITQYFLLADLSNLIYIISTALNLYVLIKNPYAYIAITNKIYEFIVFQKSGVLIYSYNFDTGEETDDSILKGSILIGINHILSNFINKKDQVELIKMQDRDIVFEFNITYGYALLLITNQKCVIITRAVKSFMEKFNEINKELLEKIDKASMLIDISEFKNIKELINEYFKPYIRGIKKRFS